MSEKLMDYLLAYNVLENAKNEWPNAPAIYDEYGTITFSELFTEVELLKNKLITLGVGPKSCTGVMSRNSRNFIIGIFGVIGTGSAVMPMSHQLKEAEIKQILSEADLKYVLDDYSGLQPFSNENLNISLSINGFRFNSTGLTADFAPHVENPAFMRFTSGTTGKAKGVVISHKSAVERIEAANKMLKLGVNDRVIWVLPMAYHFVVSILLYVRYGAAIAIAKDFLPQNIIEITNKYRGTLLYASPMQIRLLSRISEEVSLTSLNHVISTSAAISIDICQNFEKKYQIPVSQAYGIIEIGLPIINYSKSNTYPDAVGYALPDYSVEILSDEGEILGPDQIGILAIKGPGMFDAYLKPATKREAVLQNGFFMTADYATKALDGLIKVEGRQLSMINVSGNKVFPEEVEGVLETIPEIKLARIIGVPHPLMGQIVQAEVMLHPGKTIDSEEVLTYCRKRLSTYKIPQKLIVVDSLPLTSTGKLKRAT